MSKRGIGVVFIGTQVEKKRWRCGKTQTTPFFVYENWGAWNAFLSFSPHENTHFEQITGEFAIERTNEWLHDVACKWKTQHFAQDKDNLHHKK